MGRKLSCNGYWLFARFLRRQMLRQGSLQVHCDMVQFNPIASHYWEQMERGLKENWKREAKAYSKTPEFKALQARHRRLTAIDGPLQRQRRRTKALRRARQLEEEEEDDHDYPNGVQVLGMEGEDGPQLVALLDHIETDSALGSSIAGSVLSLLDLDEADEDAQGHVPDAVPDTLPDTVPDLAALLLHEDPNATLHASDTETDQEDEPGHSPAIAPAPLSYAAAVKRH